MVRWLVGFVAVVLLIAGGGLGMAVAEATSDTASDGSEVAAMSTEPADGPHVWIQIHLTQDGDAEWAIQYRFNVTTDEQKVAFDELVEGVREGDISTDLDRSAVEAFRDQAVAATDRDMQIEDARWEDSVDSDIGVLSFVFTWTDFTTRDGGEVYLGDVFRSPEGTWLASLDEGMRLTIVAPEVFDIDQTPALATQDGTQLTFDGPVQFSAGDLDTVYIDTTFVEDEGTPWHLLAFLLALIAVTSVMVAVGFRQSRRIHGGPGSASAGAGDPLDTIDEELLSDAERVERLLRENGGRMKQASIVEATDWSNAKVSQLLSEMAEEGRVEKLRIGQENLISLPEYAAE